MGLRYRKSISLAPGVKLNVGKKSAGISVGGKYGGVSVNSRTGARARVSAPGTGVSYSTKIGSSSSRRSKSYKDDLDLDLDHDYDTDLEIQSIEDALENNIPDDVDIPELDMDSNNHSGSNSGKRPKKSPKKKWYQKTWFIILMLIIFFPVGLFLLWKYTNIKKPLKILITALVGLIFIFANSSVLDELILEIPDYQEEYLTDSHINVNILTEPEDFLTESNSKDLEFITSSDSISFDKNGIYTGDVAGTYEVSVKLGSTESNTLSIHVVEREDIQEEQFTDSTAESQSNDIPVVEEHTSSDVDNELNAVSEAPEEEIPVEQEKEVTEEIVPVTPIIQEPANEVTETSNAVSSESTDNNVAMVWVDDTAKRYHIKNGCGMDNAYQVTIDQAVSMGKTPCGRCYK